MLLLSLWQSYISEIYGRQKVIIPQINEEDRKEKDLRQSPGRWSCASDSSIFDEKNYFNFLS